jgi:hypothetical protein
MRSWLYPAAIAAVVGCLGPAVHAAPVPIAEYLFNSSANNVTPVTPGTQAAGNPAAPNLTMIGDDGTTPTNRVGGVGPSGQVSDTVLLPVTASTSKAIAKFVGDIPQLDNLKSYTTTVWIKGHTVSAASDRLYVYGGNDGGVAGAIELEANPLGTGATTGNFNIKVSNSAQAGGGKYTADQWSFVAITYDGTATTGNLKAYYGDVATGFSATPVFTTDNATGTLPNPAIQQLLVGNRASDLARAAGFAIDDLTFFGSKTDASGALSTADLQSVFANGLANVSSTPEPTTLGLFGLGMTGLLARRARRRHV